MADYSTLKAAIADYVKDRTGLDTIDGDGLQETLLAMVNALGANYQFAGIAKLTPTQTDPGTPDQNVFYIAAEPGTYTNFPISGGYLQVAENEVAIFKYNGQWSKETTGAATAEQVTELGQKASTTLSKTVSIVQIERNTISTVDGTNRDGYPNRARTIGYIQAPFKITMASGYKINACLRYSVSPTGEINYIQDTGGGVSEISEAADGYLYRMSFKKDDNTDFSEADLYDCVIGFDGNVEISPYINVNQLVGVTTYFTLATAIAAVESMRRIPGAIITYRESATQWRTWQYRAGLTDDTYWLNTASWELLKSATFTEPAGLSKTTGEDVIPGYLSTPFLPAVSGILFLGNQGANTAAVCFYDKTFEFISAIIMPQSGRVNGVLGTTGYEIPVNAAYVRICGYDSDCFVAYVGSFVSPFSVNLWKKSKTREFTSLLESGYAYSVGSLSEGDTITKSANASISCIAIPCKTGDVFEIQGKGAGGPRLYAWATSSMKLTAVSSMAEANLNFQGKVVAPVDGYLIFNNWSSVYPNPYIAKNNRTISYSPATWMAMGDSITEGWYSYKDAEYPHGHGVLDASKTWVSKATTITGKTCRNVGVGGTGYLYKGPQGTGTNARELVGTIDFTGVELVSMAYGINDYKGGSTLGTMQDDVSVGGTVVSNMRYVIEKIQEANPLAKIIVIMPFNAAGYYGQELGTEADNYALGHLVNGKTLQDFYDAFVEVCEYYGIQYIDTTHSSIISRHAIAEQLPDGVHPSENCHTIIAREMAIRITMY